MTDQPEQLLPAVTIQCDAWNSETLAYIRSYMEELLMKDRDDYQILPTSLKQIIITDRYEETYQRIAVEYGLKKPLVKEAEYVSAAKICHKQNTSKPELTLIVHAGVFDGTNNPADEINHLFLQEIAEEMLPVELQNQHSYLPFGPVADTAKVFFTDCFEALYAQIRLAPEGRAETKPHIAVKNILAPFRRRIKWLHLKHQADLNWDDCVYGFYEAAHQFLKHYVSIFQYKIEFEELKEFVAVIEQFEKGLWEQSTHIIKKEAYDLSFVTTTIIEIAKLCFFELKESGEMKVADNPKKLFPDLIDTHDRIVGFVDILGFSQMIRNFDKEKDIKNLTELKEVVEEAIEEIQKQFKYGNHDLEFRLFSDCLSISLPYFDNDYDFTHAFSAVMLGLKTYQAKLLLKGYLVRGGIAIGPYYSDYNMIFSGALVEAYEFEKNCNTRKIQEYSYRPPRILISPSIIAKLENTRVSFATFPFFENAILKDNDGEYFLNPVFSTAASREVYETILQQLEDSDDLAIQLLQEMNKSIIGSLLPLVSPGMEPIMLAGITQILDERIGSLSNPKEIAKYEWTKELLREMSNGFSGSKFLRHKINFKEVVRDWGAPQ